MKEHSGNGKSNNNNLDPTLDEHRQAGGHREPTRVPGSDDAIGQAGEPGGKMRQAERGRGEAGPNTSTSPIDVP